MRREAVGKFSKVSFVGLSRSDLCPGPSSTVCLNIFQSVKFHKSSLGATTRLPARVIQTHRNVIKATNSPTGLYRAVSTRFELLKINIWTRTKPHVFKTKLEGSNTRPGDVVTSHAVQLVSRDSFIAFDLAAQAPIPSQRWTYLSSVSDLTRQVTLKNKKNKK